MKLSTMQLTAIANLFNEKEKQLSEYIGNLSLDDVKEESRFKKSIADIKEYILLKSVEIGEPKITNNRQITRPVPENQQIFYGKEIQRQAITVSYPYSGSDEVFQFRSLEGAFPIASIYTPSYNTIDVEVELQSLDKTEALNKANEEMKTTFLLIEKNNPAIESWSNNMAHRIEELADQKRKELLEFYS